MFTRPTSDTSPHAWPRGEQARLSPPGFPRAMGNHWDQTPDHLGTWGLEGDLLSQAGLTEEPGCPLAGTGREGHRLEH